MSHEVEGSPRPGVGGLARELEAVRESAEFRGPVGSAAHHEQTNGHLALIYESLDEQFTAVVPFIRHGLERGERCLYVADENSRTEVLDRLREAGIDVDAALDSGALVVLTADETYLENGTFDLDASLALLEEAMEAGIADFEGFRVTVEETWLLREESTPEDFMALEARVNDLFHDRECYALCQYNRERFPPEIIQDVIRTHPYLISDSRVTQNFYYEPPDEFFGSEPAATAVDRRLETLQEQTTTQQAHQRVVKALEAAREGISLLDENGVFIYVNDAYADTFGYDPEEMIGESWDDLGIEADPEYVYDEVLPTIDREGQWMGTTTCVRSDGSTFLAQHSLTQTEDDELICVIRNVTERKERERALEESRSRYQTLVENFPNGAVALVDEDLRYRTVGGTPVDVEADAAADLEGAHVREAISTEMAEVLVPRFRAAFDGESSTFEHEHDGKHSRIHVLPVRDDDGEVFVAMGMSQDITQRKAHERALHRLSEITSDPELSFEEKLERLLDLGCEWFDLEMGALSHLPSWDGKFQVEKSVGFDVDPEDSPLRTDPGDGCFCRSTITEDRPVSRVDVRGTDCADDPIHTDLGLTSYLGTKVVSGSTPYGTLWFGDTEPREEPFSDTECTFIELMGQWVSYEVERREHEGELRERTEHLSAIIETTPDCIKTVAPDGTLLQMNPAGLDMAEADSESEVTGECVYDLVAPEHRDRYREFNERICRGERGTLEFDIIDLEGTRRHMESHAAPLNRPDGTTVQVALTRDITEQVERERELQRTLDLLERTERIADVGGWEIDPETMDVYWTDHVFDLLDVEADEGPPLEEALDMCYAADRPTVENVIENALDSGEPFDVEVRVRTAGGKLRWLRLQGVPETDEGEDVTLRGVIQDITERKHREQRLEEVIDKLETSNDRLKQFAYAASHDLQEPLRMVSSYMQLLENQYRDELDEDAQKFIDFAVDGADRMRAMVDDLLAYSRVEQSDTEFEPVECDAILERVTADLQVQIEENDADIVVESLPTITADSEQVEQLFQNLLSNAIKYSGDEPPQIEISAEKRADYWEFAVADNGIGIDSAKTDRIFEVFKRLHHDDEYSGTGVGLSLCQEIVGNHGGDIWVESDPGEGSTFYVTLPGADGA